MEKRLQQIEDEAEDCYLWKEERSFKEILFENKMSKLTEKLYRQMDESSRLDISIKHNLEELKHGNLLEES
ncbi:hypothetical protein ACYUJ6_15210 [Clostridium sp. JNZ X4-2]